MRVSLIMFLSSFADTGLLGRGCVIRHQPKNFSVTHLSKILSVGVSSVSTVTHLFIYYVLNKQQRSMIYQTAMNHQPLATHQCKVWSCNGILNTSQQ